MAETRRMGRCGVDNCKQTRYTLQDGQWYCRNGHLKSGEVEMEADDEGFGQVGRAARREKTEVRKVLKLLRGRKGFELYIKCYQILLQKQVWWLVKTMGAGEELEIIVRDLWALRLQILTWTLPEVAASQPTSRASSKGPEYDGESSASSYLYTSDSDCTVSTTRSSRRRRQKRVPKAADRPKLIESLSLCYLGLLLLKTGVNLGDFYRWVESQQLIYLRAINEIPEAMKEKLSAEYWRSFDPPHAVKRGVLHTTVRNMIVAFHEKFGITFPPINKELLLAGYINELGLPLEIYTATKWLAEELFITFEWPSLEKGLTSRKEGHWPDAKLMALVIIAVKLSYGLDRVKRKPERNTDLLATELPWPKWEKFLREGNDARHGNLHKEGAFGGKSKLQVDVMESDVFMMQDKDMDWYLEWYEKTWLGTNDEGGSGVKNPNNLPQGLLNLFPIGKPETHDLPAAAAAEEGTTTTEGEGEASSPNTKDMKSDLQTRLVDLNKATVFQEKAPGIRSGEEYLYFTTEEDLPSQLRTLMQAAADLLGIERKELMQVVTALDVQLHQHIVRTRREERRRKMMAVGGGIQDAVRIMSDGPEQDAREGDETSQEQQDAENSDEEPELPPPREAVVSPEL
ncbi:hypothetical protein BZA77DRAFT_345832 [Pyronema omphalodes]|nr:hypothetical protein BZA77DRAFT_345832 [Pyronema omphalodes]